MTQDKISMEDLKAIALADIRARRGCEGIADIAISYVSNPRSRNNWALAIVAYGDADRDAAQLAALVVQRDLQRKYDIIIE